MLGMIDKGSTASMAGIRHLQHGKKNTQPWSRMEREREGEPLGTMNVPLETSPDGPHHFPPLVAQAAHEPTKWGSIKTNHAHAQYI